MSGKAIGWAFEQEGLTPTQKLVLVALADNAQDDGECWPSQKHLATKTGLAERTVRGALEAIESAGLIERTHRQRENGSRRSDLYVLALQPADAAGGSNRQMTGANRHLTTGQPAGDAALEPSVEPQRLREKPQPSREKQRLEPFPEGSRPRYRHYVGLEEVARAKRAKLRWDAVFRAEDAYPGRDLDLEAQKFVTYWLHGGGENRPMRDAGGSWRNWIQRAPFKRAGDGMDAHVAGILSNNESFAEIARQEGLPDLAEDFEGEA